MHCLEITRSTGKVLIRAKMGDGKLHRLPETYMERGRMA
ncbi:hypothetical protein DCCM_2183 [Desulfocucumis palustris]|uniref:Uncharacterized protein n=1 Tax=Desulfocucumis palustris TaxID=1898651 RepID=A0A2L2XFS4_9FIRM|nr:hypothetical protein DCCM_2183 [Desulfocucumis palustris]